MNVPVHPARIMLRGDERYNPRFPEPEVRPGDGATRITGVMRPDSPEGVAVKPPLPDIPFRFIVPPDANYTAINFEVWRRLQSGETLWDLDFVPPPPPPQEASSGAGGLVLGAVAFGVLLLAFNSRN